MSLEIDLLQEIRDDVRSFRTEMSGALVQIASINTWRAEREKNEERARIEERVRRLEGRDAYMVGLGVGAGTAASVIVSFVFKILGKG